MANNIKTNRKKDILLATELPTLLIKQKKDTMYITADTLYGARIDDLPRKLNKARDSVGILKDTSLNKYFEAFHNVKIYSDSLQATCDSLFYSLSDSTIRLLNKPIIWSNNNQISGDTIYMFLNNRKPEQLLVFENAFAINKVDTTKYFNQLKGTKLTAWFEDGALVKMKTKGSAENIYFALDEQKKFVGINHSSAQSIEVNFEDNEVSRVVFINQLNGKMSPLGQTNNEELKLKGFKWLEDKRPKSKYEILSPKK
jgi:hypothetical protein